MRKKCCAFCALVGKNARLQGVSAGSRAMHARMIAGIEEYGIKPVIDSIFPFARVVEAFRALEKGQHFAKISTDFAIQKEDANP